MAIIPKVANISAQHSAIMTKAKATYDALVPQLLSILKVGSPNAVAVSYRMSQVADNVHGHPSVTVGITSLQSTRGKPLYDAIGIAGCGDDFFITGGPGNYTVTFNAPIAGLETIGTASTAGSHVTDRRGYSRRFLEDKYTIGTSIMLFVICLLLLGISYVLFDRPMRSNMDDAAQFARWLLSIASPFVAAIMHK